MGMSKSPVACARAAFIGLFLFLACLAFPANVVVPRMDLITRGAMNGGEFTLQTFGDLIMEIQGGYKFGGSLAFSVLNTNLENLSLSPSGLGLGFLSASITIRDLFSLPLSLTYFVGQNDTFASGDGFALFGAPPIMTTYRGFMYFPTGPLYDGIYQIQGTGAKFEFVPKIETLSIDYYIYEDTRATYPGISEPPQPPIITSLGTYSTDLRVLLNYAAIKLEGFTGATLNPSSRDYFFRGGLLFYATNRNVEFLGQIGIPKWDPSVDSTPNINDFYLLVEPRLHMGKFSHHPHVLLAPFLLYAGRSEPGRGGFVRREPQPRARRPHAGHAAGRPGDEPAVHVGHAGSVLAGPVAGHHHARRPVEASAGQPDLAVQLVGRHPGLRRRPGAVLRRRGAPCD